MRQIFLTIMFFNILILRDLEKILYAILHNIWLFVRTFQYVSNIFKALFLTLVISWCKELKLIICYISSCPTKPSKYCWDQQWVPPSWLVNYNDHCLLLSNQFFVLVICLLVYLFTCFSHNLILRVCARRCRHQLYLNLHYI